MGDTGTNSNGPAQGPPQGYVANTNKSVSYGAPKGPNDDRGGDGGGGSSYSGGYGSADDGYNPRGKQVSSSNASNIPNYKYITNFLSEAQSTEFREGERRDVGDPTADKEFLGTNKILGDETVLTGMTPFDNSKRGQFLKGQGAGFSSEISGDGSVEQQMGSATPGGEIGEGQQGFGARALGGSDTVVENMAPPGAEQTETPVGQTQSDLQIDPNIPQLGPGQSVVPDVNYVLPTAGQQQIIAFSPNDPQAMYTARGPLSRNLTTARSGFGMKYL